MKKNFGFFKQLDIGGTVVLSPYLSYPTMVIPPGSKVALPLGALVDILPATLTCSVDIVQADAAYLRPLQHSQNSTTVYNMCPHLGFVYWVNMVTGVVRRWWLPTFALPSDVDPAHPQPIDWGRATDYPVAGVVADRLRSTFFTGAAE